MEYQGTVFTLKALELTVDSVYENPPNMLHALHLYILVRKIPMSMIPLNPHSSFFLNQWATSSHDQRSEFLSGANIVHCRDCQFS